jgi:hypothetical protein
MKRSAVLLAVLIVPLGIAGSCGQAASDDPKSGLIQAAKGADLKGYAFASTEDDSAATASFTSPVVKTDLALKDGSNVVVGYKAVRDRKKNTTTNYRQEIARSGRSVSFVLTDLGTNQVVDRQTLAVPQDDGNGGGGGGSETSCPPCSQVMHDWECNRRSALLCEANRTCQIQHDHLICGDGCPHFTMFVAPTRPICSLVSFPIPDRLSIN